MDGAGRTDRRRGKRPLLLAASVRLLSAKPAGSGRTADGQLPGPAASVSRTLLGAACYRYEPCTVLPERAGLTKNKIQPSTLETNGLRGERGYSYETVSDAQTILPELLDFLQNDTSDGVKAYLQMEKRVSRVCIFLRADRACGVPRAARCGAEPMLRKLRSGRQPDERTGADGCAGVSGALFRRKR